MLAYFVIAALCTVVLVRRPGRAPKVYFTLFFAALFRGIDSVFCTFNTLAHQDELWYSEPTYRRKMIAVASIPGLLDGWSRALLFLSICLLVRDRQISLRLHGRFESAPLAYYTISALLVGLAIASAGCIVIYEEYAFRAILTGVDIADKTWTRIGLGLFLSILSTSFLSHISWIVVLGYILYTYRIYCRNGGMNDKVKHNIFLYFCTGTYSSLFRFSRRFLSLLCQLTPGF